MVFLRFKSSLDGVVIVLNAKEIAFAFSDFDKGVSSTKVTMKNGANFQLDTDIDSFYLKLAEASKS